MSGQSVYVDLSPVIRTINQVADTLGRNLAVVDGKVDVLSHEQQLTKDRIDQLYQEFTDFVSADAKQKQLQLAASEIIRVRQELEKKFGYYDKVRRTTTGILQATDVAIVRQETMHSATEQLMLSAPGYWLAPALVALTAWVQNNRTLAEKAMNESIKRDDSRTSLFFALLCRRAGRMEANAKWIARYFQVQNPMSMDREVVVMLDALANGVFGGASLLACSQVVEHWLTELEQQAGFLDEQRKRWAEKLDVMTPTVGANEYTTLRSNSAGGQQLMQSLSAARRNQIVHDFFHQLFTGEIVVPPSLEAAADELLNSLVTKYDEEELPLRKEERLLQLIKDEQGDVAAAKRKAAAEDETFEQKTNFAALLTSSAMNPEQFGATRATQRYAVSRSRNWILAAHQDLVGRDRSQVPNEIELACGSWKGKTTDGTNERQLTADLTEHYAARTQQAMAAAKLTPGIWIVLVAGALFGMAAILSGGLIFGLIIVGAVTAFFLWKHQSLKQVRENARLAMENERDQALRILKACTAEIADYRRELTREDGKAKTVTEFVESLSAPQFILQRPEQARATFA